MGISVLFQLRGKIPTGVGLRIYRIGEYQDSFGGDIKYLHGTNLIQKVMLLKKKKYM